MKPENQANNSQPASLVKQDEIDEITKYIESSFSEMENLGLRKQQSKIEGFELSEMRITEPNVYPFDFNPLPYFDQLLSTGVLKPLESKSLDDNFNKWVKDKRQYKMAFLLFWIVFVMKFPNKVEGNLGKILNYLRRKIGKNYVKFFAFLPKPKEELMNLMIFTAGYVTQLAFFFIFPRDRTHFKLRFILDVYHIAVFELNGIYVSDFYVQSNFEKIFTSKFLDYERQNQPGRLQKMKTLHVGPVSSNPNNKGHHGEKYFLGKKLTYPNLISVDGGLEFAEELASRLRYPANKSKKLMSQMTGIPRNAHIDNHNLQVPKIENFAEQAKQTETKLNIEDAEKLRNVLRSDDVSATQNTEGMKKSGHVAPNEDEVEEGKSLIKEILSGRLKFNCIQISPTVSQVLSNPSMTLPFKKRKVINHSVDRLEGQNIDYRDVIENIRIEKLKKKELKPAVRVKTHVKSLTGHYNIKMEYTEKAKKYPNLFQDMEDMHEILRVHDSRFTQLYSSLQTLQNQSDRRMKLSHLKKPSEKETSFSGQKKKKDVTMDEGVNLNQTVNSTILKLPPIKEGIIEKVKDHERTASLATVSTLENSLILMTGPATTGKKRAKFFNTPIDPQEETGITQESMKTDSRNDRGYLPAILNENITSHQPDEDGLPARFKEEVQFKYKDLRKDYIDKYHPIINRNPDENINSLVQNILSKQNLLNKNLGKMVKSAPKAKGKL